MPRTSTASETVFAICFQETERLQRRARILQRCWGGKENGRKEGVSLRVGTALGDFENISKRRGKIQEKLITFLKENFK